MRWLLPVALLLAGCPDNPGVGDGGSHHNPPQVWLTLDGSELKVRLITKEPPPF